MFDVDGGGSISERNQETGHGSRHDEQAEKIFRR